MKKQTNKNIDLVNKVRKTKANKFSGKIEFDGIRLEYAKRGIDLFDNRNNLLGELNKEDTKQLIKNLQSVESKMEIVKKLPICPYCKKEVETLIYSDKAVRFMNFYIDCDSLASYDELSCNSESDEKYYCPHCDKLITESDKIAKEFLLGNIEFEWLYIYYNTMDEDIGHTIHSVNDIEMAKEHFYGGMEHSASEKIEKITTTLLPRYNTRRISNE